MVILEDEENAAVLEMGKGSNVKLAPLDCAIVFREQDGGFCPEIFLPDYETGEEKASYAATICSIISMRLGEDEFIKDCYDWMDAKMREVQESLNEEGDNDEG